MADNPFFLRIFLAFNYCRSSYRSGLCCSNRQSCRGNVCEIGRERIIMAVQDPRCCGLNGRSSKGNRRKARTIIIMVESFVKCPSNCPTPDKALRLTRPSTTVRSCRRTRTSRSDRHDTFLWPPCRGLIKESSVCACRDGKPCCCVLIMHSTHKLMDLGSAHHTSSVG